MPELDVSTIVLLLCVCGFTAAAAISDLRSWRIPNKLTAPAFVLGLVYQISFFQFDGLLNAVKGFAIGFGLLFILWLIGGGGGGDVKLMGAVSVWLGYMQTLWVLAFSTLIVVLGTLGVMLYSVLTHGTKKTKKEYFASSTKKNVGAGGETVEQRQQRRIMAYALPVAVASWMVLGWFHILKPMSGVDQKLNKQPVPVAKS